MPTSSAAENLKFRVYLTQLRAGASERNVESLSICIGLLVIALHSVSSTEQSIFASS
jgi:hypothetical protein